MNGAVNPPEAPSRPTATAALAILALLALYGALLFAPPSRINGDTAWLITVVERLTAGARAYVDVIETNPPMAFLIYWPAVVLGRLTGIAPETAVYIQTLTIGIVSAGMTLRLARRQLRLAPIGLAVFGAAIVVALFLMPSHSFTQREHLALIFVLPATISLAGRAANASPGLVIAIAAGLMAGLGASIKPHFVLVVALPALGGAVVTCKWRVVVAPEVLAAAGVFLIYGAVWFFQYPEFFHTPLFLVANSYRLYSYAPLEYLEDLPAVIFLFCCAVGLGLTLLLVRSPEIVAVALAMAGFAIAFIEQGKGFYYHLYPVAAVGLILAALAIARGTAERDGRLPPLRALIFLAAAALGAAQSTRFSAMYPDSSGLRRAIIAEKANPSIIIMSYDIAVNFPLVRQIDATWASRLQSTWISNSAFTAIAKGLSPEQRARTERTIAIEQQWLAEDISRQKPDILVFDHKLTFDRMRTSERFRQAFDAHYRAIGTAQDERFLLYRRIE